MISGISAAVACLVLFVTVPVMAASYIANQAYQHKAYIILSGHYYYATVQQVPVSKIGEKVSTVKRVGDWNMKSDGDSNEFPPETANDSRIGEKYAVKVTMKQLNFLSSYIEVQRGDQVEQPELKTILSAKNNPEEVEIAFDNI